MGNLVLREERLQILKGVSFIIVRMLYAFGVAFGGMEGCEEGGRGGALSACFSGFSNVILKGGCPPFFQGTFLHVFLCFARMPTRRDICHHFVDFGDIFVEV